MGSENLFHKRKARNNDAQQRRKAKRDSNKRYLIVCEGTKTEPNYLSDLITDLRIHAQVSVVPNDGTSPKCIVAHALKLYGEDALCGDPYDTVYCVFDRDKHETFAAAVQRTKELSAQGKPLTAITSTPCFEVWLLLHFDYTSQPFHAAGKQSVGEQVVKQLKNKPEFISYGKGQKGIYAQLKNKLGDALKHAQRLRTENAQSNDNPKTQSDNPATDVDTLVLALQALQKNTKEK